MLETFKYLDFLPQGYCVLDKDQKVCFWNRSLEIWSSLDRSMVLGVNIRVICPKLSNDSYRLRLVNAIETRTPAIFSAQIHSHLIPCKSENDEMQTHQTYVIPLDNDFTAIVVENVTKTFQVINKYRDLVSDLELAKEEAIIAEQTKSRFLANMSHEIRTPLNGIIGFCEEIAADKDLKDEHRDLLNMVLSCGKSLSVIINDVLDYSKLDANKMTLDPKPININQSLSAMVEFHHQSKINLHAKLNFSSEVDDETWIEIDDVRLNQVIGNLISNALKFTKVGNVDVMVSMSQLQEDSRLIIRVKDSGIGMNQEQLDKLFEPFQQADTSTTRNFGGTGLGLSIAKAFLDLMNAQIKVESEPNKGTTFTIDIPCSTCEAPKTQEKQSLTEILASSDIKSLKVLVAEDNHTNRLLIEKQLDRLKLQSDFANNGLEALNMIQEKPYDLILMDCQMPVMDGYESCRRIRELQKISQPTIIALTANVLKEEIDLCYKSGMDGVLAKPLSIRDLASQLRALVVQQEKRAS